MFIFHDVCANATNSLESARPDDLPKFSDVP